jgi:hypothetical protein
LIVLYQSRDGDPDMLAHILKDKELTIPDERYDLLCEGSQGPI